MALDIETRLKGTRRGHIIQEFFTNSGHFPLAIVLFEFLLEGPRIFPTRPDIYVRLAESACRALPERAPVGLARQLSVKGKADPLIVYPLK